MCVHWECAWCQFQVLVLAPAYPTLHKYAQCYCQILVLAPAYPTLHKYAHSTSERSCVSTGNVRGASAKYWYQHQHIQHYTNTPTALHKLHVCPLGMCVVLVPNICISTSISNTTQKHPVLVSNIGISTSISNITQIRPQQLRNFMCVHWECAWCQCQILVLAPAYPTLHKYAHSTSERSCVSTGNVRGASAKYWYQHQHIQHYKIIPQHFRKVMCVHWECAWCQCQILVLAPAYTTLHKYAHSSLETSCVSTGNVRGASAKYWYQHQHIKHYTNTPTALQKGHVCPLGMCVVLVPNIGISTSISNTTQIRPQHFRKVMCVHWECAWCQCQIFVLARAYPILHNYAHSTSETSCVSTGNVRGASAKYWYQHQHIQHYTNTPTVIKKLHVCPLGMCVVLVPNIGISTSMSNATQIRPQHFRKVLYVHWECAWCQCQILVLAPAYPTLQNKPTALQKGHVCPLGMCVVLVPNIGISTSIYNITQIRPQKFRNFMCVHWECAWCQFQVLVLAPAYPTLHKYAQCYCKILVLAPAYPTLHKYAHSTSERSCVSTGNVRGASAKYWYQHQHIQHYTNTPTALHKLHVCPLGMCVVLVPNIGISTSISNTTQKHPVLVSNIGISTSISNITQIRPQQLRNFMCVHWECAWCQCQILVLAPAYPTLHKYAHSTSERSCVSTGNVRGARAKYWYQHEHIQYYTITPTALQKLHVCPLGMYVVLVPNIGISTSISNTTQIRPQHFRKVMCVHWECAWCQCQVLVLAPAYPTLHKYAHSTSERSCVSTGNVRGASAKYWYQHQHIQHYKISPQHFRKVMCVHWECAWCQCQILVLAPAYTTLHKYAHSSLETSCVSTGNVRGASAKYWYQHQHIQHYTNTPTALQKGHVCPLGMCVVLVPNIGISTSISNTTQIRPQHFRNLMCVHWECAWCQCQVLVLAPAYPTLHKYAHSTSERSCVSTGNVRGASAKYRYQHQHIQHYKISPQHFRKVMCVHWECAWCQCQILVLAPAYTTLHKYAHSSLETSCVSTGNVRGASAKYWYQHQHIQHYTNTPTVIQKLHVCPLGMCVVLVPNIGISTSMSNATQIRPQHFRKVLYVHWECAWCQCQILVLAPTYPILHKYAHSTSETSCVPTGNVRGASAKYWYQHQHIQHYTNTPTALQKSHVCPLGMCVVLVPNIGISTSISNSTK